MHGAVIVAVLEFLKMHGRSQFGLWRNVRRPVSFIINGAVDLRRRIDVQLPGLDLRRSADFPGDVQIAYKRQQIAAQMSANEFFSAK